MSGGGDPAQAEPGCGGGGHLAQAGHAQPWQAVLNTVEGKGGVRRKERILEIK